MHNIYESGGGDHIKCLIITPTRELALQIDQACEGFGYFSGTSSVAIYGGGSGSDFDREKNALTTGRRHRHRDAGPNAQPHELGLCRPVQN